MKEFHGVRQPTDDPRSPDRHEHISRDRDGVLLWTGLRGKRERSGLHLSVTDRIDTVGHSRIDVVKCPRDSRGLIM